MAQRIRALSQTGLVYSLSEYDTERYEELSRLSDEITALATGLKPDDVASGYRKSISVRLSLTRKTRFCWSVRKWTDVGRCPADGAMWGIPRKR